MPFFTYENCRMKGRCARGQLVGLLSIEGNLVWFWRRVAGREDPFYQHTNSPFKSVTNMVFDPLAVIAGLVASLRTNPQLAMLAIFMMYKVYSSRFQPFPESGPRVKAITTEEEFKELVQQTPQKGKAKVCIVDFYATWCPPCRMAVPVYNQLSEEFQNVNFFKVDVEANRTVATSQKIVAMPTFKFYTDGKCVATVKGFSQSELTKNLNSLTKKE